MTITAEQREKRRQHIGASDAPAILGVCPFRTAYDIWVSKVRGTDPVLDGNAQRRVMVGNILEEGLLSHVERTRGITLERSRFAIAADGILAANFDGYSPELIVECKTTSMPEAWEHGVPEHVLIQVQHQLYVANQDTALVVALFLSDPVDYKEFLVRRDDSLIKRIVGECLAFWEKYVITQTPPPQGSRYRLPTISESLIQEYLDAKEQAKRAANLYRRITHCLGTADRVTVGEYTIARHHRSTVTLDVHRLKLFHPGVYRDVLVKKQIPVVRIQRSANHVDGDT